MKDEDEIKAAPGDTAKVPPAAPPLPTTRLVEKRAVVVPDEEQEFPL
jgi:hypothetical protein